MVGEPRLLAPCTRTLVRKGLAKTSSHQFPPHHNSPDFLCSPYSTHLLGVPIVPQKATRLTRCLSMRNIHIQKWTLAPPSFSSTLESDLIECLSLWNHALTLTKANTRWSDHHMCIRTLSHISRCLASSVLSAIILDSAPSSAQQNPPATMNEPLMQEI